MALPKILLKRGVSKYSRRRIQCALAAGGFQDMENSKMGRKSLEIQMKKNKS
jgi:hypothetical protein